MGERSCERCGKRPATTSDVLLVGGALRTEALCLNCASSKLRGRMLVAGGALAALTTALVTAFVIDRRERAAHSAADSAGPPPAPAQAQRAGSPVFARYRTPTLNAFGRDLSQLAADNRLDPVIGRSAEIERVVRVLARRTKNNPVLIGEAGVGKTAIVEGLALRIAAGDVPRPLQRKRIVQLALGGIVAGTKYRGEFEARLSKMLEEVRRNADEVILFIDELHTIVGAGSAEGSTVDAANMLKPELARGDIRCIGATTFEEYRRHIETDAALERRFQPIIVDEPTSAQTLEMLRGVRDRYERHHGVALPDDALENAVRLSVRYVPDRRLPDKAFDAIDEAAAMVALRGDHTVSTHDVAHIVSGWTGMPLSTLEEGELDRLVRLEDGLRARIVGQERALSAVAESVRRARAGMADARGPMGALLFVGPSGSGKTELARATAHELFGDDEALLRFDMSEFSNPLSAARLVGAGPGIPGAQRGGELTEAIRRRPYSVVLFDDVDRAHGSVVDLLLQVLDDGRLGDAHGRKVSFRDALVILTASLPPGAALADVGSLISPDIVNRLDDVVVFDPLGVAELRRIVERHVEPAIAAAEEQGIGVEVSPAALDALTAEANDARQGARLVRRVVERRIRTPLAEKILRGRVSRGQRLRVDVNAAGELVIE